VAVWSGWIAAALVPLAASIPLIVRLRRGKRAPPTSTPTRWHVIVGMVVAAVAFFHTLTAVLALGSPSAIGAGELALGSGALAFLVLLAHTGLGLQLRKPKLRRRAEIRRQHWITATLIVIAIAIHAWLLLTAAEA
jgi:hypothetical protein